MKQKKVLPITAFFAILLFALSMVFLGGCSKSEEPKEEPTKTEITFKDSDLILIMGEQKITYGEIKEYWAVLNQKDPSELDGAALEDKQSVFSSYAKTAIMVEDALERDLENTPEFARRMLLWEAEVLPELHWQKEIVAKINPTDEALLQHIAPALPDVKLRVLVFATNDAAQSAYDRIKAGEDILEICKNESKGLLKAKGCVADWTNEFDSAMFPSPVSKKFLATDIGAISKPFFQDIGFMVVETLEKRTAEELRKKELENQRGRLVYKIRSQEMDMRAAKWREAADITVYTDALAAYPSDKNPETVLLEIDGQKFTAFELFFDMALGSHGEQPFQSRIEKFIEKFLTISKARKLDIDKTPSYVARKALVRFDILSKILLKALTKEVDDTPITDEEWVAYYEKNKAEFELGLRRPIYIIHLATEQAAKNVWEKLEEGKSFAKAAEEYSLDNISNKKGGDIGVREKAKLNPELAELAFSLEAGVYSKPASFNFGEGDVWLIVSAGDVLEPTVLDIDSAKTPTIAGRIKTKKRTKLLADAMGRLVEKHGMKFADYLDKEEND